MMHIPKRFSALASATPRPDSTEAMIGFLSEIWTYNPQAYTFIGTRCGERWKDHPIAGDRPKEIARILREYSPDVYDIYFCPNAFKEPSRKKEHPRQSRYAWCDIDDADPSGYDPQPNVLWETTPDRYQGLWIWRDRLSGHVAEQISRAIVRKDGGDKGGWTVTKMLRVPGTVNHKPNHTKPHVVLRRFDPEPQRIPKGIWRHEPRLRVAAVEVGSITIAGIDTQDVMRRYRRSMSLFARTLMAATRVLYPDRSEAIFIIVSELITAGAADPEIASVLIINPHFVEKHGHDLAMAEREIVSIRSKMEAGR